MKISSPSHLRSRFLAHLACFWLALVAFAGLTLGPQSARAAVTEAWVHRYNNVLTNATDQAFKVVRDAAGDVIVTGSTDDGKTGLDILTIKYSGADGTVLWQKRYNGPGNRNDQVRALAVDSGGNVVLTGSSLNGDGPTDYYTAKYAAADGALLWEKRYHAGAYSGDARAVAVDASGNVVVTGDSQGGYYTAKYAAADGALLWEKRYSGPANYTHLPHQSQAVAVDGSGNVVVTGSSIGGVDSIGNRRHDFYTATYAAADGALLWERRYNGLRGDGGAQAVVVDGSGNVVVTGSVGTAINVIYPAYYTYNTYTAKYAAADGALLWEKRRDGPENDFPRVAHALGLDGSGNVIVTGSSLVVKDFVSRYDYYTVKYAAADGALLWEKGHHGPANHYNDLARAVTVDRGGNVVVTGSSNHEPPAYDTDYYTAKYAATDGALLWEKRYNGPANSYDEAQAVSVDSSGDVVVTGYSGNYPDFDYYTAKYAATDGALLWEKRYAGLAKRNDQASAEAVDSSGNVVLTGTFSGEYYTAKYTTADGALLWEKRGPGGGANAVALDRSGNVVVTGSSPDLNLGVECYTAKYATGDGALLWEKRYKAPSSGVAVAVDSNGNVVVTGNSDNGSTKSYYTAKYAGSDGALQWENAWENGGAVALALDAGGNPVVLCCAAGSHSIATAKYAAADGALLWNKQFFGVANGLALDGSGNVVVTGASYSFDMGFITMDFYTAKYAATDGALLWEKRHAGLANSDEASAVAVDSSGNVVVTGASYNNDEASSDYYTAKYAASDGALIWEKRYDGADDLARALAVDSGGNVVVTGSSGTWQNTYYYYTAKYASAHGALLWEKRYNTANAGDSPTSLVLGPNGMVVITGTSAGDYATVVYQETLPPISIELVPTGIRLRSTGVPGQNYTIERTPSVIGPWTTLNTQTAPASGLLEYLEAPTPLGQAFYRTVQP